MKFLIALIALIAIISINVMASTPFYSCMGEGEEGLVFKVSVSEMERVLNDEIGYTEGLNIGTLEIGPDSLMVIEQDRDDDRMIPLSDVNEKIAVEIKLEDSVWLKAICRFKL